MAKDHYRVLEVSPQASREVIDAAYRALMKRYHPDIYKGDTQRIARELNEAHEVLLDPDKRAMYDQDRGRSDPKVVGGYRLLEKIAEGGFGKTRKAQHVLTGELVCIKHCSLVSPQNESLLISEAKAIWDLRHFSIPVMRDLLRFEDGTLALVMSYIPGSTLQQVVEKVGKLDPEHVAWIAERTINALKYLHYHGVVHGDIKPQNIIIQPENHTVVVIDYGLSLVKPTSKSGAVGYTEFFAPPEQTLGKPLVPESDFYNLGMTMLYALCGGDIGRLARKEIPISTPTPLTDFIRRLIVRDVLSRPRWDQEDLMETIGEVRKQSFGRSRSNMKPFPKI